MHRFGRCIFIKYLSAIFFEGIRNFEYTWPSPSFSDRGIPYLTKF